MPELPEVETTIRYLRPALLNQIVRELTVTNGGESTFNVPLAEAKQNIEQKSFLALSRRGKFMLFELESPDSIHSSQTNGFIVGHLRMSGRYKIDDKVIDHPHNRFQLHLDNGKIVNYIDQRRFGTLHFTDDFDNYPGLQRLGPDILTDDVTAEFLRSRLAKLKKPIYSALLDQSIVAGLGNIYVNEILHATGIHPLTQSNAISLEQTTLILDQAKRILSKALELKGTTLIDNLYQDPEGKIGKFAKLLQVYGKKNDPNVSILKVGGRSVFVNRKTELRK